MINNNGTNARKELPAGWRWARLGEVASYINGRAFKPEDWSLSGLPIVRIQNLNSPRASFNYFEGEVDPAYLLADGDLLISWSASLDTYIWQRGPAILNQHIFKVIEHNDIIRRDYLYFAVQHAMKEIRSRVHGATMSHITKPEFESIKIILPPLATQCAIARQLEREMAEVARLRAAAERQRQAAAVLPSAYLREVFESEEAREWPVVRLGDVCDRITDGTHDPPPFTTNGVPFLFVKNIVAGKIDFNVAKYVSQQTYEELTRRCRPERGDILYSAVGSFGVAVVIETDQPFTFQRHIAIIKAKKDQISPQFASHYLNSPEGRKKRKSSFGRRTTYCNAEINHEFQASTSSTFAAIYFSSKARIRHGRSHTLTK